MASEPAKIIHNDTSLKVKLPMTQPTGKIRIKRRSFFAEYGMPVASRQEQLTTECYVEWQIGYDLLAKPENRAKTNLVDYEFVNYKGEQKYPYELAEIVFFAFNLGLIAKQEIRNTYEKIKAIEQDQMIDTIDKMRISRTSPVETVINDMDFYEMKVSYPIIVHKFGNYDIHTEVMNREKQRGVGVQPMLYVCIPVTMLSFGTDPLSRVLQSKETSDWVIGKPEAQLSLELFRIFGMLSNKHRHDVLAILEKMFSWL